MQLNFKNKARQHQIRFRENYLGLKSFNKYKTWLIDKAAKDGKNFYDGFGIFKAVQQRFPKFKINLYSDMLRSEHIPFNLFIPFKQNLEYCKNVFNEFFDNNIKSIEKTCVTDCKDKDNIKIEFAPAPKENYLNDRTSFDAYIEYIHKNNSRCLIGIEVKYTEKAYSLKQGSKEEKDLSDKKSKYYSISNESEIFIADSFDDLKSNNYRQIWRNQLLVESMRLKCKDKFKCSTSMTFFPEGNKHFLNASKGYVKMLKERRNKYIPVTYENFLLACYKHCPDNDRYKQWLDYLTKRYIVLEDTINIEADFYTFRKQIIKKLGYDFATQAELFFERAVYEAKENLEYSTIEDGEFALSLANFAKNKFPIIYSVGFLCEIHIFTSKIKKAKFYYKMGIQLLDENSPDYYTDKASFDRLKDLIDGENRKDYE